MLSIILLYALFASTFSLGKVLVSYTTPIFLVGIRMFVAGTLLLLYCYWQRKGLLKIEKKHWFLFLQSMLFSTYFPYILRFWGLIYIAPSKASLLYNLSPFISYIFSYFLEDEKVTFKKVLGLVIGFLGFAPLLFNSLSQQSGHALFLLPELAMIISVTSLSYGWLLVRRLIKQNNYPSTFVNGLSMFNGGLLALLTSWTCEGTCTITDPLPFLGILSVVIVVSNLICHTMYAELLKQYSPTFLAFAGFLTPLFAALYGWIFAGEIIHKSFFITSALVMTGLAIFYQDELLQQEEIEKKTITPAATPQK